MVINMYFKPIEKILILNTAHTKTVRTVAGIYAGRTATDEQGASISTINRTAPIATNGINIVQDSIGEVAVTAQSQLKWRSESTVSIVTAPR